MKKLLIQMQTKLDRIKRMFILMLGFIIVDNISAAEQVSDTIKTEAVVSKISSIEDIEQRLSILNEKMLSWGAFKVSGYVQFDVTYRQVSNDVGFSVRRGLLKGAYSNAWGAAVLQVNITEKGIGLKGAYLMAKLPKFDWLKLTGGVFDRPFGYEIEYSSSVRESPERALITTTLFPNDQDLGAKLTFQGPKNTAWNRLKLDAGILVGNGIAWEDKSKYGDMDKDFIAQISYRQDFDKMSFGVGASVYYGNVYVGNYIDALENVTQYKAYELVNKKYIAVDKALFQRQYYGIDAQYEIKSILGTTKIFGEFLIGTQPGLSGSSVSSSGSGYMNGEATFSGSHDANAGDLYLRPFMGGYVYLVQNIVNSKHSITVKYDCYDPNYMLSGTECLNIGDIKYQTLGIGYMFTLSKYLRFMAYVDLIWNENTTLHDYTYNKRDNVLTVRVQYKF
ncbi:MAG: hypothetical protein KBA02_01740 [Paludibacteraceae bacterium]|nr:hypothetical protein [Paludibacteraceae bacterium]